MADEHVVYRLPEALDPAGASPLLCAGVEVVGRSEINAALDRMRRNDVRVRFVIDVERP